MSPLHEPPVPARMACLLHLLLSWIWDICTLVRHDWATSLSLITFLHWRRKWQPTPVFLPGESQGRGSLVDYRLWGRTIRHDWSDLAAAEAAAAHQDTINELLSHLCVKTPVKPCILQEEVLHTDSQKSSLSGCCSHPSVFITCPLLAELHFYVQICYFL